MTLVLTIDEVAEMLGGWHEHALEEFHGADDRREAIMGYVEHMRSGGFECGRSVDVGKMNRLGAFLAGEGTITMAESEAWAVEFGYASQSGPSYRIDPVMVSLVSTPKEQQLYVNEERTVLARFWGDGTGEVATRDDSSAIWGPPTTVRLEA